MSADFYLGTTLGMVLALVLILVVVFRASAKKPGNPMKEANDLLRDRNEIGESQSYALQEIQCSVQQVAVWYAHYLNKEKEAMRDDLAGRAMQGIIGWEGDPHGGTESKITSNRKATPKAAAMLAYLYADAMLAERERKEGA